MCLCLPYSAGAGRATGQSAHVEESAPILDLFKRAEEGCQRQDWKFVIDSLQRVIEDPTHPLVPVDGVRYESARRRAYRMLASLPSQGLSAYHLLYDSRARRLYEDATATINVDQLRQVVNHYLLTEIGDEAAMLLASWYMDLGRPTSAISLLTELVELFPNDNAVQHAARTRLAVAYALQGYSTKAAEFVEQLREAPDPSPVGHERLEEIADYLQEVQAEGVTNAAPTSWPMWYGDGRRLGRMSSTVPAFLEALPWRLELPQESQLHWSEVLDVQQDANRFLVSHLISDGKFLYAKSQDRVLAIDPVGFEISWTSEGVPDSRTTGARTHDPEDPEVQRYLTALLADDLTAQLSVVHGMLYSLVKVDPTQLSSGGEFLNLPGGGRVRIGARGIIESGEPSYRLVAYDVANNGKIRWMLGSTGEHDAVLENAMFAAAPLPLGDGLFAPYWSKDDLYAALIDPATGTCRRSVYLCSLPEQQPQTRHSLSPAMDDQFVYIPTNAGLLLAMDSADLSLRWASRYERNIESGPAWRFPLRDSDPLESNRQWLAGPPLVCGSAVLLAPVDSSYLYAFDRATGELLWQRDQGDQTYLIGANHQDVWLGGEFITRLAVHTGRGIWRSEVQAPTGRAVLSGERILVPTREYLVSLSTETGQILERQPLPSDQQPLGNLLCLNGALYSIDSDQVRKFPDLKQSYQPARDRHEANPTDPTAAIRLAWMELLLDHPDDALSALQQVKLDDSADSQRQARQIAHLQVQALLTSVNGDPAPVDKLGRLERATEVAMTPQDKYAAITTLAAHLADTDQYDRAYELLWMYEHQQESQDLISISPSRQRLASEVLRETLQQLRAHTSPAQQRELIQALAANVPLNVTPNSSNRLALRRELAALAHGDALGNWNQRAALKLGRMALDRRRYEQAEYYLKLAQRCNNDQELRLQAMVELAQMYVNRNVNLPHLAITLINELQQTYSDRQVRDVPVEQVLGTLRHQVNARIDEIHSKFTPPPAGVRSSRPAPLGPGWMVQLSEDDSGQIADRVLTFAEPNHLAAYRPSDGGLLWECELRLMDESTYEAGPGVSSALIRLGRGSGAPPTVPPRPRRARCEGQTLLINTTTGLHAVGLVTGKRLWSVPIHLVESADEQACNDNLFDMAAGRVVVRSDPHRIDVLRGVDRELLWRVQVPEFIVDRVCISGERVLVSSQDGQAVMAFALRDGRKIFDQSFAHHLGPSAVVTVEPQNLLCGIDERQVDCYDLTNGQQRLNVPFDMVPAALAAASPTSLLLGGEDGRILLIDVTTGKRLFDGAVPVAPAGIVAGHQQSDRLCVMGHGHGFDNREVHMAAISLSKRQLLWSRKDLYLAQPTQHRLSMLADEIPLIYHLSLTIRKDRPEFLSNIASAVVLLEKDSGALSPQKYTIDFDNDDRVELTGDVQFRPHRIVLGTTGGVRILMIEDGAKDSETW